MSDLVIFSIGSGVLSALAVFFWVNPLKKPLKPLETSQKETKTVQSSEPQIQEQSAKRETALKQDKWESGLKKSRDRFLEKFKGALSLLGSEPWNDSHPLWESLEESLLTSDLGPTTTEFFLDSLKQEFKEQPDPNHLKEAIRTKMKNALDEVPLKIFAQEPKPIITMLVGVNGAGKTTTAGKLAKIAQSQGKTVILAAGDTFRAAAVEQLQAWGDRLDVEVISPAQGANPAAVAFDAVAAGLSRNVDEVIIDTAGRLHTKDNLMEELKKVVRVIQKKIPDAPHRVYLVLDATLGQNALVQAKEFAKAIAIDGAILTKLDGSAKGGAAIAISKELHLPVVFVGLGEQAEDLKTFSSDEFVRHLLP
ncbi:MAG: signal recognition particle-docking protein FtsY [Oligoflexia bacterium]|nr:signal recognition particle-docking protein FtsY [Oligoflexia bacterium]